MSPLHGDKDDHLSCRKSYKKKDDHFHLELAREPFNTPLIISLFSPPHSSPAGGAKSHACVCQTPLNLRGRRSVLPRSLLFCCEAGLMICCEAGLMLNDYVVCVNRKI